MSTFHSASTRGATAIDIASAIVAPFAKVAHFFRREAAIARAERHMEKLNDDVLRDIGVHRSQIRVAVRMGREEFGRRWL